MKLGVAFGADCGAEESSSNDYRAAIRALDVNVIFVAADDLAARAAKWATEIEAVKAEKNAEPRSEETKDDKNNQKSGAQETQERMSRRKNVKRRNGEDERN